MKKFILIAYGEDKIGIVEKVTRVLYDNNINIEDSSMARIDSEFTIMLVLNAFDQSDESVLSKSFDDVRKEVDLNISIKELKKTNREKIKTDKIFNIIVYGADKPGIVYNVAKKLSARKINISNLITEKKDDLYVMIIETGFPKNIDIFELRNELENLGIELGLTIKMKEELEVNDL